jgi:hydrogenase maturation protein HypF
MRIVVSGVVQGVGFRPYVYNLASRHALAGYVRNNSGIVEIEVQGSNPVISTFVRELAAQQPALARIERINTEPIQIEANVDGLFHILDSEQSSNNMQAFIPPDTATCANCIAELFDPQDRRYRYPFINCTECGPRFTIITSLPYDRPSTTMAVFEMCGTCRKEYNDPGNRRFHAQPNACRECGPHLSYVDHDRLRSAPTEEAALSCTLSQLSQGGIIALKGLGGFQLICDATNELAVQELRDRKKRGDKPFALMMADLEMVRQYCRYSDDEAEELISSHRPIVLLERSAGCFLPDQIAPRIGRLGIMLPYTPLHHLLLADFGKPIIATSGNLSEEPIAKENEEAFERLKEIADGFLVHDRSVHSRYDDSVVQFLSSERAILRRARGFAPLPITLPFKASYPALSCGGTLKNTFCLIQDNQAFVSQHIGDLENVETHQHFEETLRIYRELFEIDPRIVAHDCHPDYLSTVFAEEFSKDHVLPKFAVQHHHAHIVSCMTEHGVTEPVIGVAFDGLGYGLDGTLWGGEFLLVTLRESQRLAYFQNVPLPGGGQGIKQPWRMALSYMRAGESRDSVFGGEFIEELYKRYGDAQVNLVMRQIATQFNSPLISSCGRLFDAMSALIGVCLEADYEGQAAMELEALAQSISFEEIRSGRTYPCRLTDIRPPFGINVTDVLHTAYLDLISGTPASMVAARFHASLASLVVLVCAKIRNMTGVKIICLGGGVFQNSLLLRLVQDSLREHDFQVFFPQQLPANDGGLSLGQAVVALAQADALTKFESRG